MVLLETFLYLKWPIRLLIQNLILNTAMSVVDHFFYGLIGLIDYGRLKIRLIFSFQQDL